VQQCKKGHSLVGSGSRDARVIVALSTNNQKNKHQWDPTAPLETWSLISAVVESSNDAIISKDLNGIIRTWNPGAERIFGYTAEEAIGQPITMIAAPHRVNEIPGILARIAKGERIDHYETQRRTKDGRIITVSLTISPIKDPAGTIVGASKIARDISEKQRAAEERKMLLEREQEARETAELLNRLGPALLGERDVRTLLQSVTDQATRLVGAEFGSFFHNVVDERRESYMLHALSGEPVEAFEKFPMPRNTAVFGPTFSGEGIVRSDDITKDPRYGKNAPHHGVPEGHLPVRSYLAAPVLARSGDVLGGLFFGHSKTARFTARHEAILTGVAAHASIALDNARLFEQAQWAQNELQRSNEELRRANKDLEDFAYSASHDLQEPIRSIAISAQLLERHSEHLGKDAKSFLQNVIEGAGRMRQLIDDLLKYTRATRSAEGVAPAVDAATVLEGVLVALRSRIEQSGAVVTSGPLPVIAMHEVHLTQLLQNLISNALKYRTKEDPRVHISAVERDGWWVFSVADNGIGVDSRYARHIFGMFKRLHTHQEYPGSGIGLAICQRIIEQYGGRIWLEESAPGKGSVFCFAAPARRAP
jgi:PAS domain S-box-containing protein